MRTKRKLLPKSDVDGSAQGNAPSENINYVAQHVRVPELCSNIYDPECTSTEGVRHGCQNLELGRMGHLGVSQKTNITTPASLLFADDVGNVKRRRLCRVDDVGPSQPTPDQCSRDDIFREQSQMVLSGIPSAYKLVSKCEYSCEHCGALFWYDERLKSILENDRHFMENIRAYNQMFRMTSLDNEVDNRMNHFGGQNSNLHRDIVEGLIELLDTHNALVQLFRTVREKLVDTHVPNFQVRLYNVVGAHEYKLPTGDILGAIVYEPGPETKIVTPLFVKKTLCHNLGVSSKHS
nr:hypothetical protein [Tanacetum cinerariifolium]